MNMRLIPRVCLSTAIVLMFLAGGWRLNARAQRHLTDGLAMVSDSKETDFDGVPKKFKIVPMRLQAFSYGFPFKFADSSYASINNAHEYLVAAIVEDTLVGFAIIWALAQIVAITWPDVSVSKSLAETAKHVQAR